MLCEVVDEHVSPPAGQAAFANIFRGELRREAFVQPDQRLESLEHLSVTRRVRASTRDDVTPVFAAFADRIEELAALSQRPSEGVSQSVGLASGEFVRLA